MKPQSEGGLNVVFADGNVDHRLMDLIHQVIEVAAEAEGRNWSNLTVVLADDLLLKQLNNHYLKMDEPTDVLSFDMSDETPDDPTSLEGEIYISLDRANVQASGDSVRNEHSVEEEILQLVVHGFLHLCGYDHDDPDDPVRDVSLRRMIRRGEKYVRLVL